MSRQTALRSLLASSILVPASIMVLSTSSPAHAGVVVEAQKQVSSNQPLGVKKRISGWTSAPVEPVTSANAGGKLVPCILSTKYEEGTSIRFSGGGQSLLGISIVKGFDIFKPAYRYPVTVTYSGQATRRFQATSIDERTLVVPLGDAEKAYQNLIKVSKHYAPYITVGIADFEQNYALDEVASGLANLESCYGRKPLQEEEPVQEVHQQLELDLTDEEVKELEAYSAISEEQLAVISQKKAAVADDAELEPIKLEADLSAASVTEKVLETDMMESVEAVESVEQPPQPVRTLVVTPDKPKPEVVEVVKKLPAQDVITPMPQKVDLGFMHSIWVSSKGETVETVLKRWSSKAGLDFEWNRQNAIMITDDKIYRGSYEDVTQKLLADYELLAAVEGDLEDMKKRDVAFAMVQENILPEDTISRTESVEDAEARVKEYSDKPSVVGGFFNGLADLFSSKDEPEAEELVAKVPTSQVAKPQLDAWAERKFPAKVASPEMDAVPAAPVQAVAITPSPVVVEAAPAAQPVATAVPVSTVPTMVPRTRQVERVEENTDVVFKPQRWRALKGANLREVLQVWAEDAGVQLNWKSYRHYAVQESISLKVPFDNAIVHTLDQFDLQPVRPMGHLFVRPDGSEAVLTVYDSE